MRRFRFICIPKLGQANRAMASVDILNVKKSYGNHPVIHGVSVAIKHGEFVILVGPSGCGKSTLLRMIAGLEPITEGDIAIGGNVVNNLPPKDRDIAMVFQTYALYPHKTVAQNMGFALQMRKTARSEIETRVKRAAEILDLVPLLDRFPKQLSGGQRQRVAMGRAIVRDPAVFLFDEPLSNLDAKLRVQMRAEIKELHQRLKTTIVYVTHDQVEAMTMADRIVVMNNGVVEQAGTPIELYDNPKNVFVAGFIGSPSMNLLHGTIRVAAKPYFELKDGSQLPLGKTSKALDGKAAIYGIRPEHLSLGKGGVAAQVTVVEPMGYETQLFAKIGEQKIVGLFRERLSPKPGDKLSIIADTKLVHLFEGATGQRL
jgi:multiple sugar transport system ATP-binding protein